MRPAAQREGIQGAARLQTGLATTGDAVSSGRSCRADVIAAYDLGVECYERLWSPVILPAAVALVPWLSLGRQGIVLDAGSGTGALITAIRSAAPTVRVISLDASSQMPRVAHVERGTAAVQADVMALPMASEAVDAVILAYMLFHLADPLAALKEAARVLRPGGRVKTVTWASDRAERARMVWDDALAEAGVPSLPPRRLDAGLDRPEALGTLLRKAGLLPQRIWAVRFHRRWVPGSFWALATGLGGSRQRLGLIDPDARSRPAGPSQGQAGQLGPEDYLWEGEIICPVGSKPGTIGRRV